MSDFTAAESLARVARKKQNKAAHGGRIEPTTYPVTLVRPRRPPFIEVGAYTGEQLPAAGE